MDSACGIYPSSKYNGQETKQTGGNLKPNPQEKSYLKKNQRDFLMESFISCHHVHSSSLRLISLALTTFHFWSSGQTTSFIYVRENTDTKIHGPDEELDKLNFLSRESSSSRSCFVFQEAFGEYFGSLIIIPERLAPFHRDLSKRWSFHGFS